MKKFYLAYGSNLNIVEMKKRCPSSKVIGKTTLLGYKLVNRRYLTIEEEKDSKVYLGVYEIEDIDLPKLDFYEDYPNLYYKKEIEVEVNGKSVNALIYIMNEGYNIERATVSYEKVCIEGYKDFGFPEEEIKKCFRESKGLLERQQDYYRLGVTKDYNFRIMMLKKLKNVIYDNENIIYDALKKDLNKSEYESYMTEISMVYTEINYFLKNLKKLMKPRKVKTPITVFPANGYLYQEPYGNVLIIGPWNYPLQLTLAPLVGAIAGGNTAIIKTSELSPNTSMVIEKIIKEAFAEEYISVVSGGVEESTKLLKQKFNKIFFTGSVRVGKIIMEHASKNLVPVTLELGGKSPVIVTKNANLDLACKRIVWGKILNAGQTCVAPDYVFVDENIKDEFINKLKIYIVEMLGEDAINNENYPKIISKNHFDRLVNMIDKESLVFGGNYDNNKLKIAPTIFLNPNMDLKILEEEIFGPLLPVLTYDDINDAYDYILDHDKPLALYLFSDDKREQKEVIEKLSFGGGAINDTILHLTCDNLPFGGVGASGMGTYHGKASFEAFTHQKSILKKKNYLDIKLRYYPFTNEKLKKIKKLMK